MSVRLLRCVCVRVCVRVSPRWGRQAVQLQGTSASLNLVINLCGALVPTLIAFSGLYPEHPAMKRTCDVSWPKLRGKAGLVVVFSVSPCAAEPIASCGGSARCRPTRAWRGPAEFATWHVCHRIRKSAGFSVTRDAASKRSRCQASQSARTPRTSHCAAHGMLSGGSESPVRRDRSSPSV